MAEVDLEAQELRAAITAGWRTRLIYEGVKAGLIDALGDAPRSAGAIASELGLNEEAVVRVLRALATFGLCRHVAAREFALTTRGARLRKDAPNSLRGMAMHWGDRLLSSLETVGTTLETGKPGLGGGDFSKLLADPSYSEIFYRSMAEQSVPVARALAGTCDFSRFTQVMDVGGGFGALLAEVLRAHPNLEGVLYDLEGVGPGARRYLDSTGVGDRARFVPGSFFTEVPAGADCLVLKYILHDWSDPEVAGIMVNCRKALRPGDTLILVEKILPELVGPDDESVVRSDLIMMPINGKERTLPEYQKIAMDAGFSYRRYTYLVDDCYAIEVEAV